jgi:hypothetical protein
MLCRNGFVFYLCRNYIKMKAKDTLFAIACGAACCCCRMIAPAERVAAK